MSVLLLSLASPDESSLVSFNQNLPLSFLTWIKLVNKTRSFTEIRSGVPAAAAVVRSPAAVSQPVAVRLSERDPPPRGHLAARHLLHYARRL